MFDQVLSDVLNNAISKWDYSPAYPPTYSGIPGPIFTDAFNWQLDAQLQPITNQGQLSQGMISIELVPSHDGTTRTFGDVAGQNVSGQTPGTTFRLGKRYRVPILIGCWVDEQLGGLPFARKLASHVVGAMFYYRNRLTSIRHIDFVHSQERWRGQAQLFNVDLIFEGDVFWTIDV